MRSATPPVRAAPAPDPAGFQLRALGLADLPGLLSIQQACYGTGFAESGAVFARRLACPAQCSLALAGPDGVLVAYLAAYRSVQGQVTPLHGDFKATRGTDTLYLHDLAVLPALAGRGLGPALLAPLWASARAEGLRRTALVAVQGAQGWWARHGYAVQPLASAVQRQHLASYGADAVYMVRTL